MKKIEQIFLWGGALRGLNLNDLANNQEFANIISSRMINRDGGANYRLARMLGMLTKTNECKIAKDIPKEDMSLLSQMKYQYLLSAPFIVSSKCCDVMKKSPMHRYAHKTGRMPITAQMACESRWRTTQWLNNGCNGYDMSNPISNPMSFWFEQDVLLYAKLHNIELCSVYGDIITEDGREFDAEEYVDSGVFELDRPLLVTTGCNRTGCCMCGYGLNLEDRPNRIETIVKFSNPKIQKYILRGGKFNESGIWQPSSDGLGYWFVMQYLNVHGNLDMFIPDFELYEQKYGNDDTRFYLQKEF